MLTPPAFRAIKELSATLPPALPLSFRRSVVQQRCRVRAVIIGYYW